VNCEISDVLLVSVCINSASMFGVGGVFGVDEEGMLS
jgi:hypothetical protein